METHQLIAIFLKLGILQITGRLDSGKAYGHDMIRIRMLKLCGNLICYPLEIIFKRFYEMVDFHWNGNLVHRKGDKQTTKNYPLVSLLLISGKII